MVLRGVVAASHEKPARPAQIHIAAREM